MNVLIGGGGTAGHVFPAVALARELSSRGHDVRFAGTTAGQESVISRLDAIAEAAAHLKPPALTVIGDVVTLAPALTALDAPSTVEPAGLPAR